MTDKDTTTSADTPVSVPDGWRWKHLAIGLAAHLEQTEAHMQVKTGTVGSAHALEGNALREQGQKLIALAQSELAASPSPAEGVSRDAVITEEMVDAALCQYYPGEWGVDDALMQDACFVGTSRQDMRNALTAALRRSRPSPAPKDAVAHVDAIISDVKALHQASLHGYQQAIQDLGHEGDYRQADWSEAYRFLKDELAKKRAAVAPKDDAP